MPNLYGLASVYAFTWTLDYDHTHLGLYLPPRPTISDVEFLINRSVDCERLLGVPQKRGVGGEREI